jgi:hypothetical protein
VIRDNGVIWERRYSAAEIAANRASDKQALADAHAQRRAREGGFWSRLYRKIKAWF